MKTPPFFFVFDVESVGLQGQPFAVGWVVIDTFTGEEVHRDVLQSSLADAYRANGGIGSTQADLAWVVENVMPALRFADIVRGASVRQQFWKSWKDWEAKGAVMAADVPWPVEARFLMQCVMYTVWPDGPTNPQPGPYPLIDIASVRLAKGLDPLATEERRLNELPAHNPLCDARQSARLLMEALAL